MLGVAGFAAYGFWRGTPQSIVDAVRSGDLAAVRARLDRDPAEAHTQVFPQAYERASERRRYQARFGKSPWEGRLLIHEAASRIEDPTPMLDLLAGAGADLSVRLEGRTLLHLAARDGNLAVAAWLLDHGADVNATNDCSDCPEKRQTALHDAQAFRDGEMSELLLTRGARVDARSASGGTPLHVAAGRGRLLGAFVLCRYGADPSIEEGAGLKAEDLALAPQDQDPSTEPSADAEMLALWLKPGGGCSIVSEMSRVAGEPVSEDSAREVFSRTVPQPTNQEAR